MRRIKITLAYDGGGFHGWQIQPGLPTIQGTLEQILHEIEKGPVQVLGSGRTDAGVHALAQVAAFSLENPIPCENLKRAVNRLLPPAIRVLSAQEVPPTFHPRFDAVSKTYRYRIFRAEVCPPFEWPYAYHHPYPLDESAMMKRAATLEGEHDFSPFAAADDNDIEGQARIRVLYSSCLERTGDYLIYTVRGSGFLKHMVRNIVGMLLEEGRGKRPGWRAGPTAPAKGLFLVKVEYRE